MQWEEIKMLKTETEREGDWNGEKRRVSVSYLDFLIFSLCWCLGCFTDPKYSYLKTWEWDSTINCLCDAFRNSWDKSHWFHLAVTLKNFSQVISNCFPALYDLDSCSFKDLTTPSLKVWWKAVLLKTVQLLLFSLGTKGGTENFPTLLSFLQFDFTCLYYS